MRPTSSMRQDNSILNDMNSFDGNHFLKPTSNTQNGSVLENNKTINKSIIKKTFTVDSIFRPNYDNINNQSHDYIINLPETITNAVTMSISSIEIPLSYHNISEKSNNNVFRIELNKKDALGDISNAGNWDIVIAPGLYEALFTSTSQRKAQNIETQINTQIAAQVIGDGSGVSDISQHFKFKVDLNSGFGIFTYANSTATDIKMQKGWQIILNFNVNNQVATQWCSENYIYQKLGWQLGFRGDNTVIDTSSATATVVGSIASPTSVVSISPGICHISYPRYVYVCVDDFQTSSRNHFAVASESMIAPNIVARINILSCLEEKTAFKTASAPGDHLYTNKHIREYFGPTNIKKLRVQLLDEYGRHLSLNNMDWSFVASWESLYN
jgi:hypothetical protein|tara:strand:- start:171 stop:1322 length:1152 start_codon:yes stop_codon:yes gene_type:complete